MNVGDLHGGILAGCWRSLGIKGEGTRDKGRAANLPTSPLSLLPCPLSASVQECSPGELVAEPVDGEDVLRVLRCRLDLLAQPRDVNVHRPRRGHGVVAPDLVEQ